MHLHRAVVSSAGAASSELAIEGAPRRPFRVFSIGLRAVVLAVALGLATTGCLVGDPRPSSTWSPDARAPRTTVTRGLAYGPLPTQRFDLYAPEGDDDGRTIVFFHGGGWSGGSRAEVPGIVLDLARDGWKVASVSYRLTCSTSSNPLCTSARFPDQIADVKLAIRSIKGHAAELGVNPRRVVVAGYSAGGHLATIAALSSGSMEPADALMDGPTKAASSSVRAYLNFNGPTDIAAALGSKDHVGDSYLAPVAAALFPSCVVKSDKTAACEAAEVAPASAATWLDANDPPGYVFMGGTDTLVPTATHGAPFEALATAVTGDAGRVWLDVAEEGGHDAFTLVNYRSLRQWLRRTVP